MVEDPSIGNIAMFGISALSDVPFLGVGFKALRAAAQTIKMARRVAKAEKALRTVSRAGVARRARSRELTKYNQAVRKNRESTKQLIDDAKENTKNWYLY